MSTTLPTKPAKVALAIKLLYVVVGIGMIRTIMTVMRHIDVRSPDFLIMTKLAIYAFSLFLIYQLGNGKNWARWTLVVILLVNIPLTIGPSFESLSHNPVHTLLGFVQLGLYIYGLVLLFHRNVSGWFGARGNGPA